MAHLVDRIDELEVLEPAVVGAHAVHPENVWHDLPRGGTIRVVGAHMVPVRRGRCALLCVELEFNVVGELVLNLQKPKARAIRNLTRVFS